MEPYKRWHHFFTELKEETKMGKAKLDSRNQVGDTLRTDFQNLGRSFTNFAHFFAGQVLSMIPLCFTAWFVFIHPFVACLYMALLAIPMKLLLFRWISTDKSLRLLRKRAQAMFFGYASGWIFMTTIMIYILGNYFVPTG